MVIIVGPTSYALGPILWAFLGHMAHLIIILHIWAFLGHVGLSLFSNTMEGKSKFHLGAVCNAQKNMLVQLFNSIIFPLACYFFILPPHAITRDRGTIHYVIILYYIARVMIHQPASFFYEASTREFILEAEELQRLRETLTRVYVQRTGKTLWVISEDMERDVFMSATEDQAHGIVDLVAIENNGGFA